MRVELLGGVYSFICRILLILLIIIISASVSGGSKNIDNQDKQDENTCERGGNKCGSCNDKYNLVNGVCEPNFDIKSVYTVTSNNKNIILFNELYNEYITEMEVDGQKVSPSNNYEFNRMEVILYIYQ